jgi:hypothetical protein
MLEEKLLAALAKQNTLLERIDWKLWELYKLANEKMTGVIIKDGEENSKEEEKLD